VGRSPRILIEGGIYHIYNRVSRGEHAFRREAEAERLLRRLSETKRRDGFQVLAWCLMSNHSHLAVRMGEVPRGLEKYVETASRLLRRAATRRVEDEECRAMVDAVDAAVIDQYGGE
jgi:REP element-mobilizing transposase RayT